ncbi:long-chain acyl-CoA synthetase [Myxococcus hansupus]|uniref:Long-chain acyl-CoA synthetase n=1 Tax=Pseudomyxococcus hansupus TaxID=1297742 RepID=A0A0H4WWZ3_9BACT|nr:iron-containing redox enzyme family protein [Myxococcus hansupus]AKQ67921.1 long-chain acyl-CoA synthetase [Myxococcus hansupus]
MSTQTEQAVGLDWVSALAQEGRALVSALEVQPDAKRLFAGTLDREGYIHYLIQTYHYARWSTPMLAQSGHRLKRQGRHPHLAKLLVQKAGEERGHERWLLSDLKNLGCPEAHVEAATRRPAVDAYTGWNFFTSRSGVPTAFLGTAYVLEYLSQTCATGVVERLIAADTIPNIRKSVTFLRSHGALDGDHVAELESVLRTLTDPEDQAAVIFSARVTRCIYPGIFREP